MPSRKPKTTVIHLWVAEKHLTDGACSIKSMGSKDYYFAVSHFSLEIDTLKSVTLLFFGHVDFIDVV